MILARERGGRFLLRIEDIDGARSRPELAEEFRRDLAWLGLEWEEVPAQSTRLASYAAAAARLEGMGLLYRCTCTRAELGIRARRSIRAPARAGKPIPRAPSRCGWTWRRRWHSPARWSGRMSLRARSQPIRVPTAMWCWCARMPPASYHLAATLDDAADGVTLVTRGADLFAASHVHRLLQALLGLPVPRLAPPCAAARRKRRKLAKRRGSPSLADRSNAGEDGKALAQRLRMGQMPGGISRSAFPHGAL